MATTQTDANSGTKHKHGLTATDTQIKALATNTTLAAEVTARSAADTKLQAAIDKVAADLAAHIADEPPVTPPDPPGPLPAGTTPPNAVRSVAAAGGDATAAVMTWLNSLPAGTLINWDGLTLKLKQLMFETKSLRFTGAGKLIFTATLSGSAAGSIHMRNQCYDMSFNHLSTNGTPQLQMIGPMPAADYGRAHNSTESLESGHMFYMQGVQGIEIAGIQAYGFNGDGFYSGGWTAKANQWTRDLHVHDNTISTVGRMFGALADGGTNVLVENNQFGVTIPGTPIDSLAKAGPGWNGVIIEPNDAPVADGSAYGYGNVIVRNNKFGRGYHPGGVSGGMTNASAHGGTASKFTPPFTWEGNTSDPAFPWVFVNSYGNATSKNNT